MTMNSHNPLYLDYNTTTLLLPYLREHFGNPSSGLVYGNRARDAVDRARHQVATLIACPDDELIFTSGITEANDLAIRGVLVGINNRRQIVTTVILAMGVPPRQALGSVRLSLGRNTNSEDIDNDSHADD